MMIASAESNAKMFGSVVMAVFLLQYRCLVYGTWNKDCNTLNASHPVTVQDRAKYSPLVLHTLAVSTNPSNVTALTHRIMSYSTHFWLISVYKGASEMARYFKISLTDDIAVYNIHDR